MSRWLALAGGGLAGTFARYAIASWVPAAAFPYGTLLVNLSACFLVGVLHGMLQAGTLGPEARLLLITGFCGAYSTFSGWILESAGLFATGELLRGAANVVGSAAAGFLLFRLGVALVGG